MSKYFNNANDNGLNFEGVPVRNISYAGLNPNIVDPGNVADWTWLNQGTSRLYRQDDAQTLSYKQIVSSGIYRNRGFCKSIPADYSAWHIDACIEWPSTYGSTEQNTPAFGLGISLGNEIAILCSDYWNETFAVKSVTTATSAQTNLYTGSNTYDGGTKNKWWRIEFDGINYNFYYSVDGYLYKLITSLVAPILSGYADKYGFYGFTGNGTDPELLHIYASIISVNINNGVAPSL